MGNRETFAKMNFPIYVNKVCFMAAKLRVLMEFLVVKQEYIPPGLPSKGGVGLGIDFWFSLKIKKPPLRRGGWGEMFLGVEFYNHRITSLPASLRREEFDWELIFGFP